MMAQAGQPSTVSFERAFMTQLKVAGAADHSLQLGIPDQGAKTSDFRVVL
jgi:hypothetical protein